MSTFVENKGFVYWIHLEEHDNIKVDGYVGVTKGTIEKRLREHNFHAKNNGEYPIYRAIRKYGDKLIVDTIFNGNYEGCLHIEEYLRPKSDIGWNLRVGGEVGNRWGKSSRLKASDSAKKRGISDSCRKAQSESMKSRLGKDSVRAKIANIYTADGTIVAYNVCINEWCRDELNDSSKARGITCTANKNNRRKTAYGYYAEYIKNKENLCQVS